MNISRLKKLIDGNRANHRNTRRRSRGMRWRWGAGDRLNEIEQRESEYILALAALCRELKCEVPEGYDECENGDSPPPPATEPRTLFTEDIEFLDQIHRAGGTDAVMLCGPLMREELEYDHAEVQFCIQTYLTTHA